jgi:hypothetical protein
LSKPEWGQWIFCHQVARLVKEGCQSLCQPSPPNFFYRPINRDEGWNFGQNLTALASRKLVGQKMVQCFFYTAQCRTSRPMPPFYDRPHLFFLPNTQCPVPHSTLRFYSSSPPSASTYFDRISFHCRCHRVSVHIPNKLTAEKHTPLLMLSQILSVTVSYALFLSVSAWFPSQLESPHVRTSRIRMPPQK